MTQLRVFITELVDDGQPLFVRCVVKDAAGVRHEFVEKLPIVSTADSLPADDASIACVVVDVRCDAEGRRIVTVDVSCPWGCETIDGQTILDVLEHQLVPSDDVWLALDGRWLSPASIGVNDGLDYGRHVDDALVYQAVFPLACLDWYAPVFAALADEMREDDELDAPEDRSEFAQIGYVRTLAEAAEQPRVLAEIIETFGDRVLLGQHFPFEQGTAKFVINSTDAVYVVAGQIVIRGRCWACA